MRKIIITLLIGMMTVGCGKTARLERDRLEAVQEQARLAAEAKQAKQKGYLERFTTHVYNNAWTYFLSATAVVAVSSVGALIYHRYKKTGDNGNGMSVGENQNNQQVEVHQEEEQYQEEEQQDPQKEHSDVITDHHEETEEEVETEDLEDFNPPANPVQAEDPPVDVPGAILVPHGKNIPPANNNHHPVELAYGFPIRAYPGIRKKPFYNPGRNKLTWAKSDQNKYNKVKHMKDLNQ